MLPIKKSLLAVSLFFMIPLVARADNPALKSVEIQVENVFVAHDGFDDNDRIQIVVHGVLWNSCYRTAETVVEPMGDGHTLNVRQFAGVIQNGICGDQPASMPPELGVSVPFNKVVDIGALRADKYELRFKAGKDKFAFTALNVVEAKVPTIDDVPYAAVGSIMIREVVTSTEDIKLTLSGLITSTCTELDQVKVIQEDDVIIVLPLLKLNADVACASTMEPFVKEVSLGQLPPREYLVHVRSANGNSVNHVFRVVK